VLLRQYHHQIRNKNQQDSGSAVMIDKQTIFASGLALKKELDLGNTGKRKR
jgi:hypothetical protein